MKNVFLRVSAGGLLLAGAALLSPPVLATGQPSLHIVRDGKGALIQSIDVAAWNWDAARGVLEVSSTAGDRVCAGVPKGNGRRLLILDGRAYPLDSVRLPKTSGGSITVTPVSKGAFPACVPQATGASPAVTIAKGATGLSAEFDLIADLAAIEREIDVGGQIRYTPASATRLFGRISATVAETLLCLERPSADGDQLRLTDANGVQADYMGIAAVEFRPGSRLLDLDFSPGLLCFAPTAISVEQLPPMLSAADDPLCPNVEIEPTGLPFVDGFESEPTIPGQADLKFDARLVRAPSLDGDSLQYEYIVQNCGLAAIDSVALRDYFPATGPATVALDSSWSVCDPARSGCVAVGTGSRYVDTELGRLEAGDRVVIRADRPLTGGGAGDRLRIDAVALVNDGSKAVPDHIALSHPVTILETGNLAPVLTVPGTLPTAQAPFELDEDSAETRLDNADTFRLRLDDPDGSGISCDAEDGCASIQSSRPDVIGPEDVRVEFSSPGGDGGILRVYVTPKPNAFGEVTLTIAGVDAEGGVSNGAAIVIDVLNVNDPPSFRIAAGGEFPPPESKRVVTDKGVGTILTASSYCELVQDGPTGGFAFDDPTCAAQRWVAGVEFPASFLQYAGWLDAVSAGPFGEPETVEVTITRDDPNTIFQNFVADNDGDGQLVYTLDDGRRGAATIIVTATDQEGLETSVEIRVSVANAIPVITPVVGQLEITEDFEGVVDNLDATDSDVEDTIVEWSIIGATPSSFADAFTISPNGVLRVADAGPIDFEALPVDGKFVDVVVGASDGIDVGTATIRIDVTNTDDEPPVEADGTDTQVSIAAGAGLNMTSSNLLVTDVDSADATSRYRLVQGNSDIRVRRDGVTLEEGEFFTQADVDSKSVRLVVDAEAGNGIKLLAFQLEDAVGNVNPDVLTFVVNVSQP
ncbi:MAG: cadherin-like domain-containing protein [Pseudomonadota bacterium]